jgi:uncharacterized protein (TIGR02217 family)
MSTPGFLEIQLDPNTNWGTTGGLSYNTIVVANPSRSAETRFPQQSRGYWNLSINLTDKSQDQMKDIASHFDAVEGKAWGWRFRNKREYFTSNDGCKTRAPEALTLYAGGTTLQLTHVRSSLGRTSIIPIRKPDLNSVGGITGTGTTPFTLYINGVAWASSGNWTLDTTTGIITFASDQTGNTFMWDGEWDTPMRFDVDDQTASWDDFDVLAWDSINIMEIQV